MGLKNGEVMVKKDTQIIEKINFKFTLIPSYNSFRRNLHFPIAVFFNKSLGWFLSFLLAKWLPKLKIVTKE